MGIAKNHLDDYEIAKDILFKIGALKACEYHEDYWYDTGAFFGSAIYSHATAYLNNHRQEYPSIDMVSFHDAIKAVMSEAGIESKCPICAKIELE